MTLRERIKRIQYFDNLMDVKVILLELVDEYLLQFLTDAPQDGNTYGRKDGTWQIVTGGGGGINSIQAGNNISIDNTDPTSPVINASANMQGLQEVVDTGDTWTDGTDSIALGSGGIYLTKDITDPANGFVGTIDTDGVSAAFVLIENTGGVSKHSIVQVYTATGNCSLDSEAGLSIQNDLSKGVGQLKSDNIDAGESVLLKFPTKPTGNYFIATTEDVTRTISSTATGISATIQDNRLIDAMEVSLVIVNGIITQMPTFDPVTGTITQATTTNDPITIFYTKL